MPDLDGMEVVRANAVGLRSSLQELWLRREIVRAFAARHIRVKYSQTAFGALWAILQPVALLVPFAIFFGRVAKVSGGGAPYPAFALSALVPWQFVTNGVSLASTAVVTEGALLRKVYFPREAPVLGLVGAIMVDLVIGLVLGIPLAVFLGAHVTWTLVYLPLLALTLSVPVLAISLPLAAVNVYYRDLRYGLPLILQVWMFMSPVVFPLTEIAARWRPLYVACNPVAGMLEGFRRVMSIGAAPDWGLLGISLASSVVLMLAGHRLFKRLEPSLSDIV